MVAICFGEVYNEFIILPRLNGERENYEKNIITFMCDYFDDNFVVNGFL